MKHGNMPDRATKKAPDTMVGSLRTPLGHGVIAHRDARHAACGAQSVLRRSHNIMSCEAGSRRFIKYHGCHEVHKYTVSDVCRTQASGCLVNIYHSLDD
ncbi:hypothetical protein [Prevotella sp. MGM1]|uniref:hypothetical protein n=1 Tax=Prevotella sp. MGM1 TaxID=2033405 RepID=UPI0011AFEC82|nr:hypothetical protein [Prevotella sp. MGM1]